jgi:hypothetical protein
LETLENVETVLFRRSLLGIVEVAGGEDEPEELEEDASSGPFSLRRESKRRPKIIVCLSVGVDGEVCRRAERPRAGRRREERRRRRGGWAEADDDDDEGKRNRPREGGDEFEETAAFGLFIPPPPRPERSGAEWSGEKKEAALPRNKVFNSIGLGPRFPNQATIRSRDHPSRVYVSKTRSRHRRRRPLSERFRSLCSFPCILSLRIRMVSPDIERRSGCPWRRDGCHPHPRLYIILTVVANQLGCGE